MKKREEQEDRHRGKGEEIKPVVNPATGRYADGTSSRVSHSNLLYLADPAIVSIALGSRATAPAPLLDEDFSTSDGERRGRDLGSIQKGATTESDEFPSASTILQHSREEK